MKLYLSSYRIPNVDELFKLVRSPRRKTAMAVIPNAKDYYADRARHHKVNEFCAYAQALEFQTRIVDLCDHRNATALFQDLREADIVWAVGGNTFCLRHEMRQSGFDEIVQDLLAEGIVYGGASAGAIVAGRSLSGVEFSDELEFAEETIWEGLGLVDLGIVPHADNPGFKETAIQMRNIQRTQGEVVMLNDSQALVVDGEGRRIVNAV